MMPRLSLLFVFLISLALGASAQKQSTTFILVRHAEKSKDDPKDPSLNEEGLQRVEKLGQLLSAQSIDAIYSTPYKRTMGTVQPLAEKHGLEIQNYDFKGLNEFLGGIIRKYPGGTVIISGHSNTTPYLANILIGEEKFEQFDDSDYGNVLVISASEVGTGKVTILRY